MQVGIKENIANSILMLVDNLLASNVARDRDVLTLVGKASHIGSLILLLVPFFDTFVECALLHLDDTNSDFFFSLSLSLSLSYGSALSSRVPKGPFNAHSIPTRTIG